MVICCIEQAKTSPILFEDIPYIRIDSHTKPLKDDKTLEKKLWSSLLDSSFETDISMKSVEIGEIEKFINLSGYV